MASPRSTWPDARFVLGLALPALALYNVLHHPAVAGWGTLVILVGIALAESLVPALRYSPAPAGPRPGLLWLLRLHVPLQIALLAAGFVAAARAQPGELAGIAVAVGFVTGAQGITFAHELGHSRRRADRALAWLLMTSVAYPHFMVEHYRGHHVRAATFDDPASARRGESLWRFLPRTLAGSFLSGWRLEAARLRRHGLGAWRSPLVFCTAAIMAFTAGLALVHEWRLLAFWLLQAAVAVWLLETVNYIEHYGLVRATGPDARPEPFGAAHAWNADHTLSNALLANLQRHSDHHMHAWKPFPELAVLDAPRLPTGYAGCILLAAVPPLWFACMHPRLAALAPAESRA